MKYKCILIILAVVLLVGAFCWGIRNTSKHEPVIVEVEEEIVETLPYERYFRAEAENLGWDWCLLAAVCYEESHFNPEAKSYGGALGLMQLMPVTAQRFGLNDSTVFCPKDNIHAGVEYIAYLQNTYSFITDSVENIHFVLASYNAGPAHIMDARRLAKKHNGNPNKWFGETEEWLKRLYEEEYYTDSVVKYGQFNAQETTSYVNKVLRRTKQYQNLENQ